MPHDSNLASFRFGANNPTPMGSFAQIRQGKREHQAHEIRLAQIAAKGENRNRTPGPNFMRGLNARIEAGGPTGGGAPGTGGTTGTGSRRDVNVLQATASYSPKIAGTLGRAQAGQGAPTLGNNVPPQQAQVARRNRYLQDFLSNQAINSRPRFG